MTARTAPTDGTRSAAHLIALAERHGARNYDPLPVVIAEGDGAWVTDVDGRRYLDALAGYSALNFGHRHPALVAAATAQLGRVTLTSRAFHNDRLGPFLQSLTQLLDQVLVAGTSLLQSAPQGSRSQVQLCRHFFQRVLIGQMAPGDIAHATDNIIALSGLT